VPADDSRVGLGREADATCAEGREFGEMRRSKNELFRAELCLLHLYFDFWNLARPDLDVRAARQIFL
jgi:hypothetical protein